MPAGEQGGVLEPADRAGGGEEERRDCREGGGGPGSGSTFPGLGQVLGEAGLRGAQAGAGEHRGSQGEPHEDVALPTAGPSLLASTHQSVWKIFLHFRLRTTLSCRP